MSAVVIDIVDVNVGIPLGGLNATVGHAEPHDGPVTVEDNVTV